MGSVGIEKSGLVWQFATQAVGGYRNRYRAEARIVFAFSVGLLSGPSVSPRCSIVSRVVSPTGGPASPGSPRRVLDRASRPHELRPAADLSDLVNS